MAKLAVYAAQDNRSSGRLHSEASPVYCTEYQRDCERIMHSNAFRRLKYKTQVFVSHEGTYFRSRLTHSLEMAQLSRTIARSLNLNEDLTESISLGSNLGQTPFGHAGQDSLQQCMQNHGGFEASLQSLRVVDELETQYANFRGLNLTFETREGILRYCSPKQAKSLGTIGARFLAGGQPFPPSLESQIVDLCDTIAYIKHDVEDSLRTGLITVAQLREYQLFEDHYSVAITQWPKLPQQQIVYETIRGMVNEQIANLIETSKAQLDALQPQSIDKVRMAEEPMITFSALMLEKHMELKQFLRTHVYQHHEVQRISFKAKQIIRRLFELFNNAPFLLPSTVHSEIQRLQTRLGGDAGRVRAVGDYIAGLSDYQAHSEYERLFNLSHLP